MHDIEHVELSCHVALGTDGGKPQPTHRRSHGQIFDANPTPLQIEHVAGRTVAAIENRFRAVPTNDDGVVRRALRVHRKGTVIDP
ncbi:MAG: hypothetical protein VX656_12685 [Candidatus Latescibacterota bacterium]|nr:hypothetical protein [Candidatus Latescibacterota bacterium]